MSRAQTMAMTTLALALSFAVVFGATDAPPDYTRTPGRIKVKLAGVGETVDVIATPDGTHRFVLHTAEGERSLTPDAFAELVYTEQATRPLALRVLNVTSYAGIVWVVLGLTGQVLFTGRMVVQWMVSERKRASVVPNIFWWMSLGGSTMLLVYFVWRKDIVGVLGQSTGWFIYLRNILLIYRHHEPRDGGA